MAVKTPGLRRYYREVRKAMDRGVDRAADYAVDLIEQLAPKDEGDLASTARKEGEEGSGRRTVKVGGAEGPNKFVGYAADVEYGTHISPAQPFFTPAVRAINVKAEVKAEVEKLCKGG